MPSVRLFQRVHGECLPWANCRINTKLLHSQFGLWCSAKYGDAGILRILYLRCNSITNFIDSHVLEFFVYVFG